MELLVAGELEDAETAFLLSFDREEKQRYPRIDINSFSEQELRDNFRFKHVDDIKKLRILLGIPNELRTESRLVANGDEALCLVLRRLCYPNRYCDLERMFGRDRTELSSIFNHTIDHLYHRFDAKFHGMNDPWFKNNLQEFADAVSAAGSPLENIVGFVDGTVRPVCRPKDHQREMFNGHKRYHGLKFQSVVAPNGLIVDLYGPIEGRRHDCFMLAESGLLNTLDTLGEDEAGRPFGIYGDPAFPQRDRLYAPFKGAQPTPLEATFNRYMSGVRQSVEWGFGNIVKHWAFLDFKKNLRLHLQPVGKLYVIGALLSNCYACMYENNISNYFGMAAPSIEEYLE